MTSTSSPDTYNMSSTSHRRPHDATFTSALADTISFMMEQECTAYYSCVDYLNNDKDRGDDCLNALPDHGGRSLPLSNKVTPEDRAMIVHWCYDLVDRCQFDRETVAVAVNMVDRFMSVTTSPAVHHQRSSCDGRGSRSQPQGLHQEFEASSSSSSSSARCILYNCGQYQLLCVTALYTSIKIGERIAFSSCDFSKASQGTYTAEEIETMERRLLHGLGWRLCAPTPLNVGLHILELMFDDEEVRGLAGQRRPQEAKDDALLPPQEEDLANIEAVTYTVAAYYRNVFRTLREELAFLTENAVRSYELATRYRASTIAVVSIINAIEQQVDDVTDYMVFMRALLCVMRVFDFDMPVVLMEARDLLKVIMKENNVEDKDGRGEAAATEEGDGDDASVDSTATIGPLEDSWCMSTTMSY